jgi:hypothetical protein
MNEARERVRKMITDIARAKWDSGEALDDPWETNSEEVKALWDVLTDPSNLSDLEEWAAEKDKYNPTAKELAEKSLARCRERCEE